MIEGCLNVTMVEQGYSSLSSLELVVLRKTTGLEELAVPPVTHFPLLLDDMVRIICKIKYNLFAWENTTCNRKR